MRVNPVIGRVPIVMLILLSFILLGCGREQAIEPVEEPVRPIRALKVGGVEVFSERSLPGRAEAYKEIDLAFRVTGPLIQVEVGVGDEVKQGDLIAKIDPRDFEVDLNNARGGLQRAIAARNLAQSELARVDSVKTGAVSETEKDRARVDFEVAEADIETFKASVAAAENALKDTDLIAPFDGVIVATYVENHEYVRAQQVVVRLLDKSQIEFTAGVPETLMTLAPYVEEVFVVFDAYPDVQIPAEIVEIGREASVTTRTFPVTVRMTPPEGVDILPGMAGRGRGTPRLPGDLDKPLDLVVPVTSVFASETDGKTYVWVIDASHAVSRREVALSELRRMGYVVTDGLQKDEVIATAGVHFLREGQIVVPEFE